MNFLFGLSGGHFPGLQLYFYIDVFLILLVGVLLVVALLMEKSLVVGNKTVFLGNEKTQPKLAAWQKPLDYAAIGIFAATLVLFLLFALGLFWYVRIFFLYHLFALAIFAILTIGLGVFVCSAKFPAGKAPAYKYTFFVLLVLLYGNLYLIARFALAAGIMMMGEWWILTIFMALPVLLFFVFFRALVKISYDLASKNPLAGGLVFLIGLYFSIHSFIFSYWNFDLLDSLMRGGRWIENPFNLLFLFLKGNGTNIPSFLVTSFIAIYSYLSYQKLNGNQPKKS